MKTDIVNFCRAVCKKYHIQCYFQQKHGVYILHLNGRGIQNFTANQFYEIPIPKRVQMIEALIKVGLYNNLESRQKDNLFTSFKKGITIVP